MQTNELNEFLNKACGGPRYIVDRVFRASDYETTELVRLSAPEMTQDIDPAFAWVGAQGALAPLAQRYVRKRINTAAGLGTVYPRLHQAQQQGAALDRLVKIVECEQRDQELTVVMEYLEGSTLDAWLVGQINRKSAVLHAFPQICDAVSQLHGVDPVAPIIHRDLKPANILVQPDGQVKLVDFGISRTFDADAQSDTVNFGTRGYASPEQFGFGQTDVRSDVYSLGMVLYFCLTGADPSGALTDDQLGEVPFAVRQVVKCATALDPRDRYASAQELKEAFMGAYKPGSLLTAGRHGLNVAGVVWDVLLACFLLLYCRALVSVAFNSAENLGLVSEFVLDVGAFGVPATLLAYVVSYKRPLQLLMPRLKSVKLWHVALAAVISVLIGIFGALMLSLLLE